MRIEKIDLYKYFGIKRKKNQAGYLNIYQYYNSPEYALKRERPAMLVIPGGAYVMRSDRENEPVAIAFMAKGYNCFTLEYSIEPVGFPSQLIEGAMAVAYIKENAKSLAIDPKHVCVVGFSAGGHLAGMLATMTGEKAVKEALGKKHKFAKPDAAILSYPVIDCGTKTHGDTSRVITCGNKDLIDYLSLQNRVDKNSVPAFIWATADDEGVPIENSFMMASAYQKAGIDYELHIFNHGVHGLSLSTRETARETDKEFLDNRPVSVWLDMATTWLKNRGFNIKG